MTDTRNYNGYSLFDDVQDPALREYNRAQVLVNMLDKNVSNGRTNLKTMYDVMAYFKLIPENERGGIYQVMAGTITKRATGLH